MNDDTNLEQLALSVSLMEKLYDPSVPRAESNVARVISYVLRSDNVKDFKLEQLLRSDPKLRQVANAAIRPVSYAALPIAAAADDNTEISQHGNESDSFIVKFRVSNSDSQAYLILFEANSELELEDGTVCRLRIESNDDLSTLVFTPLLNNKAQIIVPADDYSLALLRQKNCRLSLY